MAEEGDLRIFNPDKEISREITLEILTRHRDNMKQARTGELVGVEVEKLTDNDRKFNQVRALNLIISSQREMITISRPIINFRSIQKWRKKFKEEKDQGLNPFEEFDCDYNTMLWWANFLRDCERQIITADKTQKVTDDFIIKRDTYDGEKYELTTNFYEMLEDVETSYERIYLLMLTNKIVSAGIEEDEELTYKQKEEEFIRRIVEA